MKVTDWFPANMTPVREGVYEVVFGDSLDLYYSYFDGLRFNGGWWSAERANNNRHDDDHGITAWRGLAEKPE
jgi:hypothetical protein